MGARRYGISLRVFNGFSQNRSLYDNKIYFSRFMTLQNVHKRGPTPFKDIPGYNISLHKTDNHVIKCERRVFSCLHSNN